MKCINHAICTITKELTCCFECDRLYKCREEGKSICKERTCEYYEKTNSETFGNKKTKEFSYDPYNFEKWFIDGINKLKNPNSCLDILNWYRNLYYKFDKNTERGRVAWAINDLFMLLKKNNINLNSLESVTNDKQS